MTDCAIYWREDLTSGQQINGPAIVEELDSTTLIDPGLILTVTPEGLGIMEV